FSPLRDISLPPEIKGLILGGGYPELHVETLSRNCDLNREIRQAALDGMPVYAECGGFMFLMDKIEDLRGVLHPMAGIFPFRCRMEERFKALGYREVITERDSILGPPGTIIRGHEFHYSVISREPAGYLTIYRVTDRKGRTGIREGFQTGRVLGSYIHLHWGSNPAVARHFVEYCRRCG
ncbi:MAG: cobyrinate a,c-diamide synthase, partial [Deltaproteobacteria bacterium]